MHFHEIFVKYYDFESTKIEEIFWEIAFVLNSHSSLVKYLAQVVDAKNCPTTFYCIFQLVWVPMTTGAKETHSDILRGVHRNPH